MKLRFPFQEGELGKPTFQGGDLESDKRLTKESN